MGDKRLDIGPSFGSSAENIIIDSGTTFTYLPNDFYNKLESIVADIVSLKRVAYPYPGHYLKSSLCFEGSLDTLKVPVITAHFRGADVTLNSFHTFRPMNNRVVCFSFASSKDFGINIFGNMAQQNFLVGYDLQKKIVSFKPTDCTKH